ncbi:RNA editing complex protein MP46 [Novymonas esmeraldas]|uniref:RNA editing complex protein MP46 n=1 Tax=Novymonas esmeraldas TaxID=1808958 RepID=A0AAW0F5U7_9TRYP
MHARLGRGGGASWLLRCAAAAPPSAVWTTSPPQGGGGLCSNIGALCAFPVCVGVSYRHTTAAAAATAPATYTHTSLSPKRYATTAAAAADATGVPANEPERCLLCDAPFTSWGTHVSEHTHMARAAVCQFFIMPDRSESIMRHLERHIALDLKEVDALATRKVARRRERLLAGLLHLVEEGVLTDCLPMVPSSPEEGGGAATAAAAEAGSSSSSGAGRRAAVSGAALQVDADRFPIRILIGEAFLQREAIDRCARLMPTLSKVQLHSVVVYITSTRQLARIFDELSLGDLVTARAEKEAKAAKATTTTTTTNTAAAAAVAAPVDGNGEGAVDSRGAAPPGGCSVSLSSPPRLSLSREDKAAILYACLGELHRFHEQERPLSVASKAVADAIVLNVLAGHARENIVSELVHEALQRIVDEGTPIWREFNEDVKRRRGGSDTRDAARRSLARGGVWDAPLQLHNVRTAPLPTTPAPRPESADRMSCAAAERMISAYIPFSGVRAVKGEGGGPADEAALGHPELISVYNMAERDWLPVTKELRDRFEGWSSLPLVPRSPRFVGNK